MKEQQSLFGKKIDSVSSALFTIELGEGDEQDQIAAWQYLIDTGVVWQLQGRYGRAAVHLIDEGICTSPTKHKNS
tara:strand:- start:365 stop:589 length:225 start_codon:yes stop_codon:yes gene_type:complete